MLSLWVVEFHGRMLQVNQMIGSHYNIVLYFWNKGTYLMLLNKSMVTPHKISDKIFL